MHPLLILFIGVIAIIGLMIVLRVNAFVALISAAILISLLSPGELAVKISRVAAAFGKVVGDIGIVIALAAVIGKCLMDSGAADRIVRSFLRVLGEKRTSWALMGSGFVLSVPVFFDTVFYLLIPLARSLGRKTQKHYMLYALAIVAGAAVTHTLVPPTPGPLFMANELGIGLGTMIMIGILIGLPTAACGLVVCNLIDRRLPIPMRPYTGQQEPEPLDESRLPSLAASLAPVVLPVIFISLNTMTQITKKIMDKQEVFVSPVSFLNDETWRSVAAMTALLGNPNLALLISTVIAMIVLIRYRGLSLQELAQTTESALMSGGVIILITAGGGAFGAMLRDSGIQEWIKAILGAGSQNTGFVMLMSGFLVAILIKFAQGSGTVSMITTSSMFGAFGVSAPTLGFHPVYLAMAIGSGSLVGDWMNNSGFWIFARMSVFSEMETLRSWTILTASLGVIGFLITMGVAQMLPLV